MAFNLFKKKEEDDFSDFSTPRVESSAVDSQNMGLPLDGDITNTGVSPMGSDSMQPSNSNANNGSSNNDMNMGLPTDNGMGASAPTSFNDFNSMNNQQQQSQHSFGHPGQEIDNSIESMHKPTRTELMTKVNNIERDMELVSAKLDTIKSLLESMTHRIVHIEKAANVHNNEEVKW